MLDYRYGYFMIANNYPKMKTNPFLLSDTGDSRA
jgi:hypothetical protein